MRCAHGVRGVTSVGQMGNRGGQRQPWVNRRTWVVVAFGAGFGIFFLALAVVRPETFLRGVGGAADKADALAKAREFWLKLAAGSGAVAGALIAWGKFEISKVQLGSERFGKAVEMIGSDKTDVVLGGLYSLEALGRTTADYQSTITEVLSAFVREHAPIDEGPSDAQTSEVTAEPSARDEHKPTLRPTVTVQAALTILGRRTGWNGVTDLSEANLSGADLSGANLSEANLRRASLSGADLSGANLSGANLSGANLIGANLTGSVLSMAILYGADLTGANLTGATLTYANLLAADLPGADLQLANLGGANLGGANLGGAMLYRANLSGAILDEANLTGAGASPTTRWPNGFDPVSSGVIIL